jgi:hypothetical protein
VFDTDAFKAKGFINAKGKLNLTIFLFNFVIKMFKIHYRPVADLLPASWSWRNFRCDRQREQVQQNNHQHSSVVTLYMYVANNLFFIISIINIIFVIL